MKERATSAVYREKARLCLQCNYKQLRLNFITINEVNLAFYGYGISEGWGGPQVEKSWKFQGVGGVL